MRHVISLLTLKGSSARYILLQTALLKWSMLQFTASWKQTTPPKLIFTKAYPGPLLSLTLDKAELKAYPSGFLFLVSECCVGEMIFIFFWACRHNWRRYVGNRPKYSLPKQWPLQNRTSIKLTVIKTLNRHSSLENFIPSNSK